MVVAAVADNMRISWLISLLLAGSSLLQAQRADEDVQLFPCTSNEDCASIGELSGKAMECLDGYCQNPFLNGGCLSRRKPGWNRVRVCNSEDPPDAHLKHYCRLPPLDYQEVRIFAQNWESGSFASWILQILLGELLDVPATIETGVEGKTLNFYNPQSRFEYGSANDWEALKRSNRGDCREYDSPESCAHVILEVWASNHQEKIGNLVDEGEIEYPSGLGALGEMGWYLPKFAAEKDPSFLSYLGMSGDDNRRKLAESFLTPTTWRDYCLYVSNTSCEVPDSVAQRAPQEKDELDRMFYPEQYTGFFRKAPQNDCDANPHNCTGHFADYPCGWGSYFDSQAYHLDIAASSPRYTYGQLVDIIKAGNATQSNFMLYWWTPEALLQSFRGSSTEMIRIGLPSPTQQCLNSRISPLERCEPEVMQSPPEIRFGDPEGACDEAPQNLQKVLATSLRESAYDPTISEVERSPAYDAIVNFKINDLNFGDFVESWFVGQKDPREAACDWFVENIHVVQSFLPNGYPRILKPAEKDDIVFYVAVTIASVALALGCGATVLVAHRRNEAIMKYAQVDFLFLLLAGGILVAMGSIVNLIDPSDASCVAVIWLRDNGYTLLLVPLIVKVAAMNHLMRAARRFQRVVLTRMELFKAVAGITAIVIAYLTIWSTIDAPRKQAQYDLTDSQTQEGEYVVYVGYYCDSNSQAWRIGSIVWNFLLILCATMFAFVTRTFESQFRETQTLAFTIYSHFIFAVLRFVVTFWDSDKIQARHVQSIIYSFDVAASVLIYFVPKFFASATNLHSTSSTRISIVGDNNLLASVSASITKRFSGSKPTPLICRHCGKNPYSEPTDLELASADTKEDDVLASTREAAIESHTSAATAQISNKRLLDTEVETATSTHDHDCVVPNRRNVCSDTCCGSPLQGEHKDNKAKIRRRSWHAQTTPSSVRFEDEYPDELASPRHQDCLAGLLTGVGDGGDGLGVEMIGDDEKAQA